MFKRLREALQWHQNRWSFRPEKEKKRKLLDGTQKLSRDFEKEISIDLDCMKEDDFVGCQIQKRVTNTVVHLSKHIIDIVTKFYESRLLTLETTLWLPKSRIWHYIVLQNHFWFTFLYFHLSYQNYNNKVKYFYLKVLFPVLLGNLRP